MSRYYVLDEEKRPVEADIAEWSHRFNDASNRVDYTELADGVCVSTVFLGINHRWIGKGPPILFETMIFGGPLDGSMWRYASWDDAVTGHHAALRKAKG